MRGIQQSRHPRGRRGTATPRRLRNLAAALALVAMALPATPCAAGPAAAKPMLGAMRPVTALGALARNPATTAAAEAASPRHLENVGSDRIGFEILESLYAVVGITGNSLANLATRPPTERVLIGFRWVVKF